MRNNVFVRLALAVPFLAAGLLAASFPDAPNVATTNPPAKKASIVLAGGCFWGTQGVFEHVKGVIDTEVGYAGGERNTAQYEKVSEGNTGHAESVKVTYDPSKITYGQLLKVFFSAAHDPTTVNRQHNDVGPQYRSVIFYSDEDQKNVAEAYIGELNKAKVFGSPVVTQVVALKGFYAAEADHQHFLDRHPDQPYIAAVDIPLLENFRRTYPDLYKK